MRNEFTLSTGASGTWFGFTEGLFAAQRSYDVPSTDSLGLTRTHHAADAMHDMGRALAANLKTWEEDPSEFTKLFLGKTYERWVEVSNLCESIGNSLELVIAGLCETKGMLDANPEVDPLAPAVSAFIVEASIQYLISIGHNITNLAFRLCAEDGSLQELLAAATGDARKAYKALADGPAASAWVYHSQAGKIANQLAAVSDNAPLRCLQIASEIFELATWQDIGIARNIYFHRSRQGFREGGPGPREAANLLHSAAVDATECLGRALPSFFNRLVDSYPRTAKEGHPLMGMVYVKHAPDETLKPILADEPFVG